MKTPTKPGQQSTYDSRGRLHSIDGQPASIIVDRRGDRTTRWFKHGLLHRENGPALILPDGSEHYYLDGTQVDKQGTPLSAYQVRRRHPEPEFEDEEARTVHIRAAQAVLASPLPTFSEEVEL